MEAILTRRFPGSAADTIAAAANAIMGLRDDWEEVLHEDEQFGYHYSNRCSDICYLTREAEDGVEFRLFRRREH